MDETEEDCRDIIEARLVATERDRLEAENTRIRVWVDDLQTGMYINCVYCGHRYGPKETTPPSMADALKAHIEVCPHHPMSQLRAENERMRKAAAALLHRVEIIKTTAHPLDTTIRFADSSFDELRAAIEIEEPYVMSLDGTEPEDDMLRPDGTAAHLDA